MKKITMTLLGLAFAFSANAQDLMVKANQKTLPPEVSKDVLYSALPDGTGNGIISFYSNEPDDFGVYSADDFELQVDSELTSLTVYGFNNGENFPIDFTGMDVYIYENSADNTPAGDPTQSGSGVLELVDLAPAEGAVSYVGVGDEITIDLVEALGAPLQLEAGVYWISFAPRMNVEGADGTLRWNQYSAGSEVTGVNEPYIIDPTEFFGAGRDWNSFSSLGLTDMQSLAFTIEGNVEGDFASVQLIHNAPDPAASVVDVYVNGELAFDDFEFRSASSFRFLPAGVPLQVDIAPGTSADVSESLYNVELTLDVDESYIVVADGVIDPTQFDASVNTIDFGLQVYASARQQAASEGNTDVLVHHGSPDAPTVDVVNQADEAILVDDISFPEYNGYLELPTDDYLIDITTADNSTKVAGYQAYLAQLGLDGAAITVLASGFLDPNANQDGPEFGLWVALPSGGPLVELKDEDFMPFPAPYCGPLLFADGFGNIEPLTYVEFAGIENRTDATVDGSPGHEDFTELTAEVVQGESYDIILEGNTAGNYDNRFAVFIDWNQDGVFDADEVIEITEIISNSTGEDGQQAVQTIEVPVDALTGVTRMRIKKIFGTNAYLDPCSGAAYGQAEDYSINVGTLSNADFTRNDFSFYPNPVNDVLSISTSSTVDSIKVYNMLGQLVKESAPKTSNPQINLSEINAGVYLVSLEVEGSVQTFRVMKK